MRLRTSSRAVLLLSLVLVSSSPLRALDITPYAWQHPQVAGVGGAAADDMIERLREEVQKILERGRLAPLRIYYGDIPTVEEYWLYTEPGRIIATLGWAYPYLTSTQQTAVKSYVAAELASPTHAPWAGSILQPSAGSRRELHPLERVTYRPFAFGAGKPTVHTVYGIWLYAYRSTDWATVQAHWSAIKAMYGSRSGEGNIYGTMGAHVAMARLADRFGDAAARTTAINNLQAQLDGGVNFGTIDTRVRAIWSEMHTDRRIGHVYQGWMFLNLSPEIGRYLHDHVRSATLARTAGGRTMFPMWWLRQAGYWNRWTGDESVGIPPEMMGMIVPVERWVSRATAQDLREYTRSAPICIGDSYWLESLVQAIEATGTLTWVDVRTVAAPVPPSPATPSAPGNVRIVR
jgi:hypothetical protein